ncbi:MAG TPA: serine/threonine-protein kinase [Thermoanaerobaculia bacterium]|jgi:serine/threonine-protein kinase
MVTAERWQQIKVVLDGALDREGVERALFLDQACRGDGELRREVESYAASEGEASDFIETPVFRILLEEVEPLAVGQRVGAYRIGREIGRGGMGAVYLAERADREFEQRVAIKLVRRGMDTEEIVRRFRSERQILAHLDHLNIAKLFDGGTTEDGRPYFVMEYVEGQPIDEYCDGRELPVRARLELFRQVCAAVHFAHQNLIVHRDLKPGNILVTADGVPKLLDFGIAKLLDPDQDLYALTRADLRPMTPEYASPEQVRGETITTASDVYSLGVLLYVLLTGHRPYRAAPRDPNSLARAICEIDPVRPSSIVGRVEEIQRSDGSVAAVTPESVSRVRDGDERLLRRKLAGDLDTIVLKAMQKEPQRRYTSVDQLANDLGRHLQGLPVVARKDTVGYRTRKFVGRHKAGVGIAAAILLLIVGFSIWVTVLWQRAVREQQRAQAVSDFLEDLFSVPNPSESHGETVTAREMLDRGVQKIDVELGTQPELHADLLETMGRVYRSLGLYEKAKPLMQRALDLNRKIRGPEDLIVAQNLDNLAGVLNDLGKRKEAEPLIREAVAIQEKRGATRNIDYAKGLSNLGEIQALKGELDSAEAILKKSLAIKRSLPHPDQRAIASSLNSLGKLYATRGQYAVAEPLYLRALAIRRQLAEGNPDTEVATTLGNLASLRENVGNLAGAETYYREVLEMRRKLLESTDPRVAFALSNLGYVLVGERKMNEAESCFREALSIADENPGFDSLKRAIFLRNLSVAVLNEGKVAEAEAEIKDALLVFRAQQPPTWRTADAESVLGACLTAQGRFQEAEPLLLASYPVLKNDKGDGAKHAAEARQRILELYKAWGKPEKSVS